jgi:hypothetical protein
VIQQRHSVVTLFELSRFAAGAFQQRFGLSRRCLTTKSTVASQQNDQRIGFFAIRNLPEQIGIDQSP